MNKVFLSHSSKDKPFVLMLAADMKASEVEIWIDKVEIRVGDSLIRKISEGIIESNYVAACLSQNSVQSNWVKEELEIAATLGINNNRVLVLPILLEDCNLPPFLAHRLYIDFRHPHQYDESFRNLLKRINPEALPQAAHSFYGLTIGATRKDRLVQAARDCSMTNWVVDYLSASLQGRESHKERHFTYLALGEIGGAKARAIVKQGLDDRNDYARSGAQAAWTLLGN
jgi:hypothetical protein